MSNSIINISFETIALVAASIAVGFGFKYYRDYKEGRLQRRKQLKREKEKEKASEQTPIMSLMVKRKPKPSKAKKHEELLEYASLNEKAGRRGRK